MYEDACCAARAAHPISSVVAGRRLFSNEGKQSDADGIQMSGCSDPASRTDNTVYIINHVAKLISRR